MGIKFAIERLKFKSSTALTTWAKEYIFSVGTQTIHALVYTIFVGISYKVVSSSDVAGMAVCVLSFMFFRFMTEAEKLLRGFLKLTGDSASSIIGDADSTDIKELFGLPFLVRMKRYGKITPVPGIVRRKYEAGKKYMRHNMESEYVKIRRKDLIRKYEEAYAPDERGRRAKVYSDVDAKIDKILKTEFKYKVDDAVRRTGTSWQLLRNSGQIVIGLPVAVVENTLVGAGVVLAGTNTIYKIMGGKITGFKKFKETRELRAESGTYLKMQKWLNANATERVAHEFKKQYLDQDTESKAEDRVKIELLHEARKAELDLQYQIALLKEKWLKEETIVKKKETTQKEESIWEEKQQKEISESEEAARIRLQNELARQKRRKLKQSVEDAMKTVDRTNIQSEIKAYMKANNKYTLTFQDLEIIAEKFDVTLERGQGRENEIELEVDIEGFMENVKAEAKREFIESILMEDQINEQTIIVEESLDQVENNIIEKMEQTDNEEEKHSMSLAIKCIEDKRHEINGEKKENVYSNLTEEEQNKVKGIIKDATDDETTEKHIGKMEVKELVDTMKKAVDKEGSIQKDYPEVPEFKPIIEEVYHLKEVNELARETTGKPIYKDVGKLVENMINNEKIKLDNQNKVNGQNLT